MGDVIDFNGSTIGDVPVEQVLDSAKDLESVLILGWTKDDVLFASCSFGAVPDILFLIEKFKAVILAEHFE